MLAKGFQMDTKTASYQTGSVDYRGTLAEIPRSTASKKGRSFGTSPGRICLQTGVKADPKTGSPAVIYYTDGRAEDDEVILKADLIAQYKDSDEAVATGNVKYYSAKADISADRATIYQREKRVYLVGHVTIYVKPKSEDGKPPKEEQMPLFARTKPEEMVASNAGGKPGAQTGGKDSDRRSGGAHHSNRWGFGWHDEPGGWGRDDAGGRLRRPRRRPAAGRRRRGNLRFPTPRLPPPRRRPPRLLPPRRRPPNFRQRRRAPPGPSRRKREPLPKPRSRPAKANRPSKSSSGADKA